MGSWSPYQGWKKGDPRRNQSSGSALLGFGMGPAPDKEFQVLLRDIRDPAGALGPQGHWIFRPCTCDPRTPSSPHGCSQVMGQDVDSPVGLPLQGLRAMGPKVLLPATSWGNYFGEGQCHTWRIQGVRREKWREDRV